MQSHKHRIHDLMCNSRLLVFIVPLCTAEFERHRRQSEREVEDLSKKVRELSGHLKSQQRSSVGGGASPSSVGGGLLVTVSAEGFQEISRTSSNNEGL